MLATFCAGGGVEYGALTLHSLQHPHHPWKGWQEHHRIHKAKIDHLIMRLENGENIDTEPPADA